MQTSAPTLSGDAADLPGRRLSPLEGDTPDPEALAPSLSPQASDMLAATPTPGPADVPPTQPTEVPDEGAPEPGPADIPPTRSDDN